MMSVFTKSPEAVLIKPSVEKDCSLKFSNLSQTNTFVKYKENELLEK